MIPASRINPIAAEIPEVLSRNPTSRSLHPRPDGYDNFGNTAPNTNLNNEFGQLDYNMSDRSRMSFDVRHNRWPPTKNDYFGNIATGQHHQPRKLGRHPGRSLHDQSHQRPRPAPELHPSVREPHRSEPGFNPTSLGFPVLHRRQFAIRPAMPYVYFDTSTAFQSLGYNRPPTGPSQSAQLYGSWTKSRATTP